MVVLQNKSPGFDEIPPLLVVKIHNGVKTQFKSHKHRRSHPHATPHGEMICIGAFDLQDDHLEYKTAYESCQLLVC